MTEQAQDEQRIAELEHTLAELEAEHRRHRLALQRIAHSNSGLWGWIAHEALHPHGEGAP